MLGTRIVRTHPPPTHMHTPDVGICGDNDDDGEKVTNSCMCEIAIEQVEPTVTELKPNLLVSFV